MQEIDQDSVFSLMRELAKSNERSEVPFTKLLFTLRERKYCYHRHKLKYMLMNLHSQHKIEPSPFLPFSWIVTPSEEEVETEKKASLEVQVTDSKIFYVIKTLYSKNSNFPKPSEIEDMFWMKFGKPDSKDFTRHLRTMVEKGLLERTEDFHYYFKGLVNEEDVGLSKFVEVHI
jgi:hypothetical protein